jgi:hypothetical protein
MQKVIPLLIVCLLIIGCASQSPSFGNFMREENSYITLTRIYGDTYQDEIISKATQESDAKHKDEYDFKGSFGVIKGEKLKFGAELGLAGFSPILGYKLKNIGLMALDIGLMTWGNLSLYGIDGGAVFMQARKWNRYLIFGLSEYFSRNGATVWSDDGYSLFKSFKPNDEFNEIGLGAYSVISASKWSNWGFTIEGRTGKEIGTSNWRYYITIGFFWD